MAAGVRLGFFRGNSLASKIIRMHTGGVYTHVAPILLSSGAVIEAWVSDFCVQAHSSVGQRHSPGTHIDIFDVEHLTEFQSARLERALLSCIGKRYDHLAIFRFNRLRRDFSTGEFCSSMVSREFSNVGSPLLKRVIHSRVSPEQLSTSPLLKHVKTITV